MGKRKRHAESGERGDGANHKRAKVEDPVSNPNAGSIDRAGSDQLSKAGEGKQKHPMSVSRKHKNAERALKHKAKEEEQSEVRVDGGKEHEAPSPGSRKHNKKLKALKRAEEKGHFGPKAEVPLQKEKDKSNGHAHTEGSEHKTPLQRPRKHKNLERARKKAEKEKHSGLEVEVPAQNKKDDNVKSDGHEKSEGKDHRASLPGPRKHKNERRALKYQAQEEGQSGEKVEVPTQREERVEPADRGEISREPHPGGVALIDGELPDAPASQNIKVKLKKKHGSYFKAQRLAQRAIAATGDATKKTDSSDQNDAQGPQMILRVDPVQKTQQMPVTGKKHKRDKARKQDRKAITITESGEEPAGKDVSELMERLGGHEVQQPSSKKTKSKSSRNRKRSSVEAEGVRPVESEVVEPSGGHDVQRHSSKKRSKSGKKSKVKSTDVQEVERSLASEGALEQAVAASYPEWNIARSTGGQMLDTDPVFSKDEE